MAVQARTLKAALEHRIGTRDPPDAKVMVLAGGVCRAPDEQVRHRQRREGAATQLHGRRDNTPILEFGEKGLVHARQTRKRRIMGATTAELVVTSSGGH